MGSSDFPLRISGCLHSIHVEMSTEELKLRSGAWGGGPGWWCTFKVGTRSGVEKAMGMGAIAHHDPARQTVSSRGLPLKFFRSNSPEREEWSENWKDYQTRFVSCGRIIRQDSCPVN